MEAVSAKSRAHPHLLLTADRTDTLRSVQDVRDSLSGGHSARLWENLRREAEADLVTEPYTPASVLPHRRPGDTAAGNRDYVVVDAVATRIKRAALAHLLTGDDRFRNEVLRQLACIYDETAWPDWRDLAHLRQAADLRTGQLLRAVGFAYDWLYPALSATERRWVVEGLDRRGIRPYLAALEAGASWAFRKEPNNWMTCIVGGAGIAGMALGDDHPSSRRLVEEAVRRFEDYLNVLGPEGESNESIGYAGAMRFPIEFFAVHRYWSGYHGNRLLDPRLSRFCEWYMYFILPPGVNAAFGDTHTGTPPSVSMFAAMAAATRNPVFQWFYERHCHLTRRSDVCEELLAYDATVPAASPEGRLPRGRGFRGHSACWSSRTVWTPETTPCVVYGKGGHGAEGHGHHDAGTVCVDGYARPLITDPGCLHYPADFFGPNRYRYYNAAAWGHNIPVFGGREMHRGSDSAAVVLDMAFDDRLGAVWLADTTALYDGAIRVRRGVIHLQPATVAVLDLCDLEQAEDISLRWHTPYPVEPEAGGTFEVVRDGIRLAARVAVLGPGTPVFRRGEHAYQPPFDRNRLNGLLEQKHESYVETCLRGRGASVLTLFCVLAPGTEASRWERAGAEWRIAGCGNVSVTAGDHCLAVASDQGSLRLDLAHGTCSIG